LRTTEDSVAPLQRLVTELEATDDPARYSQLDRQLHIAIAALTDCQRLIVTSTRVQSAIFDLLSTIDVSSDARARSDAGHRALLAALLAADQYAAMNAVRAHLKDTHEVLGRELPQQRAG
jgi:GntR family transcriptional repressor for pyruvate dehydrogenase complex